MKKFASVVSLALASAGIASGCAVDSVDSGNLEAVETYEGAVCAQNPADNAIAAMFANLAATMAIEFKRMQFTQDLEIYTAPNWQERLRIKSSSLALCGTNACKGTKAILAFQDSQAKPYIFPNGQQLDGGVFASRLVAGWRGQKVCADRAINGDTSACVAEPHYFELTNTTPLSPVCGIGGLNLLTFKTSKATASGAKLFPEQRLNDASKLQRLFLWTDTDQTLPVNMNDYMQFSVSTDGVYTKFDPGEGTYPPPGTSGSCGTALLKFSYTSITGACCSYAGGTNMHYQPYAVAADGSGYWRCVNK